MDRFLFGINGPEGARSLLRVGESEEATSAERVSCLGLASLQWP